MDWKKRCRRLRRWLRDNRLFLALGCIALVLFLVIPKNAPEPVEDEYADFLAELGFRESSNNYQVVNSFGYMGKYQLGKLALRDIGFLDENGAWTDAARAYGISSREDFLNSPEGQEAAVRLYHENTYRYIRALGLDDYVGSTYCGIPVTESGLLAACHLVGVGGMEKGLTTGRHVYDGNGVSAAVYMELFAGFDISSIWTD